MTLVQQKLGHSDPNTTLWHYFNQDEERLRDASQGLTLLAIKKRPSLRLVRKGEGKEDTKATDDTAQEAVS